MRSEDLFAQNDDQILPPDVELDSQGTLTVFFVAYFSVHSILIGRLDGNFSCFHGDHCFTTY